MELNEEAVWREVVRTRAARSARRRLGFSQEARAGLTPDPENTRLRRGAALVSLTKVIFKVPLRAAR